MATSYIQISFEHQRALQIVKVSGVCFIVITIKGSNSFPGPLINVTETLIK